MENHVIFLFLFGATLFVANIDESISQSTNKTSDIAGSGTVAESICNNGEGQCSSSPRPSEKLLSRRKRYVAFPEGSSFSVMFISKTSKEYEREKLIAKVYKNDELKCVHFLYVFHFRWRSVRHWVSLATRALFTSVGQ